MRKKLWACAVCAAFLAVAGGAAVDYAWDHPNSLLGRWLFQTQPVAGFPMGPLQFTNKVAQITCQGVQGLAGQGTTLVWDHDPSGPQPMGQSEECCPVEPALLPGALILQVDRDILPAQPMAPVCDGSDRRGGAEASEEPRMPAVEDNSAVMPKVEADEEFGPETPPSVCKCLSIDTMEVRPTDLWYLHFTGPF